MIEFIRKIGVNEKERERERERMKEKCSSMEKSSEAVYIFITYVAV